MPTLPTMDELFLLYTKRYSHSDLEQGQLVEYRPISIATTPEMKAIMAESLTADECLTRMHWLIGTPGPKISRK